MKIQQIIPEHFVNLIGNDPKKQKYKGELYDLLQTAYQSIGGFKGSGADSPDDLVQNVPFWKLAIKNGKIVAAVLYKDKLGRKLVASGTDGSLAGKKAIANIIKAEPKRSYSEKSKTSLGMFLKSLDNPKEYLVPIIKVNQLFNNNIVPIKGLDPQDWPVSKKEHESAQLALGKYPYLEDFGYFRKINGEMFFKVMTGTPEIPFY